MTEKDQAIAAALKEGKSQTAICKVLSVEPDDVKRVKAALAADQLGQSQTAAARLGNADAASDTSAGTGADGGAAPDLSSEEIEAELKNLGFGNPLDFAKRLVTLERRVEVLEKAAEIHAKVLAERTGGKVPVVRLAPPPQLDPDEGPATSDEERAYSIANANGGGFDGIAAWRRAGRPGLA